MSESFLNGKITLHCGDMHEVLPLLAENSIDSCVTDPPYHLTSIVKRFGKDGSAPAQFGKDGAFSRQSRGFMGKVWDGGETAFEPETWAAVLRALKPGAHLLAFGAPKNFGFMQYAIAQAGFEVRDVVAWLFGSGFPKSHNIGDGWGTALKPAFEPIILARKPLSESTVVANVLKWGTGALNIDGSRVACDDKAPFPVGAESIDGVIATGLHSKPRCGDTSKNGRWPANLIHDGSDEVVAAFPDSVSCNSPSEARPIGSILGGARSQGAIYPGERGSAARFFYSAKADADDRLGSKHPTIKPLDLMQYLIRLVTPRGGVVLDPFSGSGTTGEAAWREGMRAVLIEREVEYQVDIRRRMKLVLAGPGERAREAIKERMKDKPADHGPLFGGNELARGGADRFTDTLPIRTNDWAGRTKAVKL